ncbi:3520_t:CDS:2 [Entrophospora sp. SA101]|nr:3520_t:CDS:2 [Entrophospora sp. SA101]
MISNLKSVGPDWLRLYREMSAREDGVQNNLEKVIPYGVYEKR